MESLAPELEFQIIWHYYKQKEKDGLLSTGTESKTVQYWVLEEFAYHVEMNNIGSLLLHTTDIH